MMTCKQMGTLSIYLENCETCVAYRSSPIPPNTSFALSLPSLSSFPSAPFLVMKSVKPVTRPKAWLWARAAHLWGHRTLLGMGSLE